LAARCQSTHHRTERCPPQGAWRSPPAHKRMAPPQARSSPPPARSEDTCKWSEPASPAPPAADAFRSGCAVSQSARNRLPRRPSRTASPMPEPRATESQPSMRGSEPPVPDLSTPDFRTNSEMPSSLPARRCSSSASFCSSPAPMSPTCSWPDRRRARRKSRSASPWAPAAD